ncbi:NADH dehydrogenase [ubiquinone] 1 alpha subcomplex subunit 7-like [Coccinella septempunctata]|uniref:NADH dehydrogenase [ubiquinone] 1 alpha subcomplex subunit 7-like n=1 Tax=Coccinella septempunctata TaxID=41139 RepID=UPI001D070E30|nr:NADH dehydrogenase [ubiquinone] 1 alpha subcomplex subunit 7-like [Coccinella septempunctata]
MAKYRDVSPILQLWRNFLFGRKHTNSQRFKDNLSSRSPPPPRIPKGPAHALSKNYYYTRDTRRKVQPPQTVELPKIKKKVPQMEKSKDKCGCSLK